MAASRSSKQQRKRLGCQARSSLRTVSGMFMRTLRERHFHADYVMHVTSSHMWTASWERKVIRALPSVVFRITGKMIRHQRRGRGVPGACRAIGHFVDWTEPFPCAQSHTEQELMGALTRRGLEGLNLTLPLFKLFYQRE